MIDFMIRSFIYGFLFGFIFNLIGILFIEYTEAIRKDEFEIKIIGILIGIICNIVITCLLVHYFK